VPQQVSSAAGVWDGGGSAAAASLLERLRKELAAQGLPALVAVGHRLRDADTEGSGSATLADFCDVIEGCGGASWTTKAATALFQSQAHRGEGGGDEGGGSGGDSDSDDGGRDADQINIDAFLAALAGPLPRHRLAIVREAFSQLADDAGDGGGTVPPAAIVEAFNAEAHPDVVSGERTSDEVMDEFLRTFDVPAAGDDGVNGRDGGVTVGEFEAYYAMVSATVGDDGDFDRMVRGVWRLARSAGPPLPSPPLQAAASEVFGQAADDGSSG
ncbi:unnamed protein product, partial [Phaeothamnion confervicola]